MYRRKTKNRKKTSNTSATRVLNERNECDTSAIRVKSFNFHDSTSESKFHTPILAIWQIKDYKENYLLETYRSLAKMHLKSAPQKLIWIEDANILAPSLVVTHSNAVLFSIKITLCETNFLFSKNY